MTHIEGWFLEALEGKRIRCVWMKENFWFCFFFFNGETTAENYIKAFTGNNIKRQRNAIQEELKVIELLYGDRRRNPKN